MGLMDNIVASAEANRASDIHIAAGLPIRLRIDGKLCNLGDHVLTAEECDAIARDAVGPQFDGMPRIEEIDMAGTYAGHVRCRLNIFQSMRSICLAIRLLSNTIPEL